MAGLTEHDLTHAHEGHAVVPGSADDGKVIMSEMFGSLEAAEYFGRTGRYMPGRPGIDESKQGESPSVRARLDRQDYAAFTRLMAKTGMTQSQLVREGVRRLLQDT